MRSRLKYNIKKRQMKTLTIKKISNIDQTLKRKKDTKTLAK